MIRCLKNRASAKLNYKGRAGEKPPTMSKNIFFLWSSQLLKGARNRPPSRFGVSKKAATAGPTNGAPYSNFGYREKS